jgi:predicted phage terminase large subunit-like protein
MKDLTGWLLENDAEAWSKIIIRQEFEPGDPDAHPSDPRTEAGELFFPERDGPEEIESQRNILQAFGFAGQHQQRPVPKDGGSWKVDQIEIVDVAPAGMIEARGWDLAASKGKGDWCVGARLGRTKDGRYVIADVVRDRTNEPRRLARLTAGLDGYEVRISVPQDPGQAGKDQVRSMVGEFAGYAFSFSLESGAKETRWEPFQAQVNGGNVLMVRGSWNAALIEEMRLNGQVNDDQLDAMARAFTVVCAPADAWIAEAERIAREHAERLEEVGISPETGVAFRLGSV